MSLSEILAEMQEIKNQYHLIAMKYGSAEYGGDCTVYIGSSMWYEELFECSSKATLESYLSMCQGNPSIEEAKADHQAAVQLIQKAEKLFKEHRLDQFLIDGGVLFWIGALPEPYVSTY